MKHRKHAALAATLLTIALAACSKASVVPISATEFRVAVDAHPNCGPTGAQKFAVDSAAVATIKQGFDLFIVVGVDERSVASGAFVTPGILSRGGVAGIARRHHNAIQVRIFKHGDKGAQGAIDARRHLGADWPTKVKRGVSC